MARFLKSRFFIIALLLAIVLVTVPSVLAIMGQGSVVRNALNVIATPFRFVITKTAESFEGFAMYFREFDDMHEENKALRAKLKELEEEEPSLHLFWNEELCQIEARLMGDIQTDIIKRLISERFAIE